MIYSTIRNPRPLEDLIAGVYISTKAVAQLQLVAKLCIHLNQFVARPRQPSSCLTNAPHAPRPFDLDQCNVHPDL